MDETTAALIFQQIFSAVEYAHSEQVRVRAHLSRHSFAPRLCTAI